MDLEEGNRHGSKIRDGGERSTRKWEREARKEIGKERSIRKE